MLLIWISVPANPLGPVTDVMNHLKAISFSFSLVPFAGVAFLWFIVALSRAIEKFRVTLRTKTRRRRRTLLPRTGCWRAGRPAFLNAGVLVR
jgi:hypothetical protein